MFHVNLATQPYSSPINSYGENLSKAGRAFIAALLAVDSTPSYGEDLTAQTPENVRAHSIDQLNELANRFDSIMPNQAAELRYLAGVDERNEGEVH